MKITAKTKKKSCQKGFPCGNSCQAQGRNCKKRLEGQSDTFQEWLKSSQSTFMSGETDNSKSSQPQKSRGVDSSKSSQSKENKGFEEYISNGRSLGKELMATASRDYALLQELDKQKSVDVDKLVLRQLEKDEKFNKLRTAFQKSQDPSQKQKNKEALLDYRP